jgi:enoyl-CoA hydratase
VTESGAGAVARPEDPPLLWSKEGAVGIATLNRPHALNAMTVEVVERFESHLDEVERGESIRVLVVSGSGDRAFCVGADLGALQQEYSGDSGPGTLANALNRLFGRLESLSWPVIAAVHGYCVGGGLELMLAADLCVAAEDARFGLPEVRVGTLAGAGGTQRLPRLIGPRRAKALMYTGEPIDAAEALLIGLVNRVVSVDTLFAETMALATAIAEQAPLAVRKTKEAVNGGLDLDLEAGLALERECDTYLYGTEDRREGVRAFVEKREPRFVGR